MTPSGFDDLVRPHLPALFRVALRMTGRREDAEDLVQEVLVKLFPRRDELAAVDRLRPWLLRVMYRLFIDTHRRQSRSPVHLAIDNQAGHPSGDLIDSFADDNAGPEQENERASRTQLLLRAIAGLSEDHRSVLSLHDIEGYTLEEMQIILDCPIGTLKSRLHRARARLRTLIEAIESQEERE